MYKDVQKCAIGKIHVKIETFNTLHIYEGRRVKRQALFVIMVYTIKKLKLIHIFNLTRVTYHTYLIYCLYLFIRFLSTFFIYL